MARDSRNSRRVTTTPTTNEELVLKLMNWSPAGMLCQAFVMEAIQRYAKACAKADPATFDSPMMNGAAWVACAKHIEAECEKFYSSNRPAHDDDADDVEPLGIGSAVIYQGEPGEITGFTVTTNDGRASHHDVQADELERDDD